MTIEMQVKIKDEKTTHTEREMLAEPVVISRDNQDLISRISRVYANFSKSQEEEGAEAPEITLKFKVDWQS